MKPYTDKLVAEWGLDEERCKAWVTFARDRLVPPCVPPSGFEASPKQMFSWLAEALRQFGEDNAMTALEVAQEDRIVEAYLDHWFNDPARGGYPKIEPRG